MWALAHVDFFFSDLKNWRLIVWKILRWNVDMINSSRRSTNPIKCISRDAKGRVNKECRCFMHDDWKSGSKSKVFNMKGCKNFKKDVLSYMFTSLENNLLSIDDMLDALIRAYVVWT